MPSTAGGWGWLRQWLGWPPPAAPAHLPLLAFVEGPHDAQFLRRISAILHAADSRLPSLSDLESGGQLVFLPMGGGALPHWAPQLTGLGKAAFYLFDRDDPSESLLRRHTVRQLNRQVRFRAFVTSKRALENYLHPAAILDARGIAVAFGDDEPVADLVAQEMFKIAGRHESWRDLSSRGRKRLRERAKRWLNTEAVERMTIERLAERDEAGEIARWLTAIAELIET